MTAAYPRELERTVSLRDGAVARIRPIRPEDAERLVEMYTRLSRHTANVDHERRLALVAEHDGPDGPTLVAVARYEPSGEPGTAEVAFVVQDGWQNRGLGTILLDALLAAAERGIRRFSAFVLAGNLRMLDMLARYMDVQQRRVVSGVVELSFTRKPTDLAAARPVSADAR